MHSSATMNNSNNNSTTSMGIPKPQAGAPHYASLEILSPQPTRRVIISILDPIEEMEEVSYTSNQQIHVTNVNLVV